VSHAKPVFTISAVSTSKITQYLIAFAHMTSETSHIFWNVWIRISKLYTANICFRMADLYN